MRVQEKSKQEGRHAPPAVPEDPANNNFKVSDLYTEFGGVVRAGVLQIAKDMIPVLGIIFATLSVFLAFLGAEHMLLAVIEWLAKDIIDRFEFVGCILVGIRILSFVAISAYFLIHCLSNLGTHWEFSRKLEQRVKSDEHN